MHPHDDDDETPPTRSSLADDYRRRKQTRPRLIPIIVLGVVGLAGLFLVAVIIGPAKSPSKLEEGEYSTFRGRFSASRWPSESNDGTDPPPEGMWAHLKTENYDPLRQQKGEYLIICGLNRYVDLPLESYATVRGRVTSVLQDIILLSDGDVIAGPRGEKVPTAKSKYKHWKEDNLLFDLRDAGR